ncbi:MAG: efflux RND transporter periplasmic adaptor subunit, partial [Cetobacterium somerae]
FGERYVEFNVSQSVVGDLKLGEEVQIEITSLNNLSIKGTITNIGTLSVGYGGTYPVKAKIVDPLDTVKVGMTAKVIVTTDNTNKVIAVPLTAILTAPNGEKYVYVVTNLENNIGIVKKQLVTLGNTTEQGSEIVSGLTDGDYVVTKGSSVLLEDQKVSLLKGAE